MSMCCLCCRSVSFWARLLLVLALLGSSVFTRAADAAERTEIPPEEPEEARQRHERVSQRRQGIAIIAHRGSVEFGHENTLEAYRATFELGGDGNEIDIWATRDGVLVCFHDYSLDVALVAYGEIRDRAWEELRRFRFRNPGPFGKHCRIPTLVEVLQLHRQYAGLLHLDIKQPGIDKAIAELLDRMDMWDHVAYCASRPELGGVILKDPRLKLRRYKTALYGNRNDVASPETIATILKRQGDDVIVDDPRGAIVTLGRKLGTVSPAPVAPLAELPAPPRTRLPPIKDLLRTLRDAGDWQHMAETPEERAKAMHQIGARAFAAEQLVAHQAASAEVFALLEERVRNRSRHKDWKYHGLDGIMALQALVRLRAPKAVELARFSLWRYDPDLANLWRDDPFLRLHGDQEIWFDFHLKRSIFPALEQLPGAETERLCRDFMAIPDEQAKKIVPVLFDQAAETLLTHRPTTETALELIKHPRGVVRGRAILHCLAHSDEPWALEALQTGASYALNYRVTQEQQP